MNICSFDLNLQCMLPLSSTSADMIRAFPAQDLNDFEDIAGLIANLDVVVSVQTAVVHLSGALGAPCLAMITDNPEWRYMRTGETLPWYGSVRLFRQSERQAWEPVVADIAQALGRIAPAAG